MTANRVVHGVESKACSGTLLYSTMQTRDRKETEVTCEFFTFQSDLQSHCFVTTVAIMTAWMFAVLSLLLTARLLTGLLYNCGF